MALGAAGIALALGANAQGVINNGAHIVIPEMAQVLVLGGQATGHYVHNSGSLRVDGQMFVSGDWTDNSAAGDAIAAASTGHLVLDGQEQQTLSGVAELGIPGLRTNNAAGVVLEQSVRIDKSLVMDAGVIVLGDNHLVLGPTASLSSGTGFGPGNMVGADGQGMMVRGVDAVGVEYLFPIGDMDNGADYSPFELVFGQASFGQGQISARVVNQKHPENESQTNFLNRYWVVGAEGVSSFSSNLTFNYSAADVAGTESSLFGGRWDGNQWELLNQASAGSFMGAVSALGDFTAGESDFMTFVEVVESNSFPLEVLQDDRGLYISVAQGNRIERLEVINLLGQVMYSQRAGDQTMNIGYEQINAVSNWYLLRVGTTQGSVVRKIFVP